MSKLDVARLYADHGEEIFQFLLTRLRCAETASDLKQETFTKLVRRSPSEPVRNPRAYLFSIAANLAVDHFRRSATNTPTTDVSTLSDLADAAPDPERRVAAACDVARLQVALDQLTDRQREIVKLHRIDGLSYIEIAERLGIARNTVMVHLSRALVKLRHDYFGDLE